MVQGCEFRVRVMKGCVASFAGCIELRVWGVGFESSGGSWGFYNYGEG